MPIPIILGGIALVAVGYGVKNLHSLKKALSGKKIAVIGGRASGKTTLVHFLNYGKTPAEYQATNAEKTKQKPSVAKELGLTLKDGVDIGGGDKFRTQWQDLIQQSDIVLYLFDFYKLKSNPDHMEDLILDELKVITEAAFETKSKKLKKIFLIATHIDLDPDFDPKFNEREKESYDEKSLMNTLFLRQMQVKLGGTDDCSLLFGSLKDSKSTESLVKDFLSHVNPAGRS